MKVVIEFYRTRNSDDAHAVVGREVREARDVADAIEIGQRLSQTLDMPQRPDAMTITASASIVMPRVSPNSSCGSTCSCAAPAYSPWKSAP